MTVRFSFTHPRLGAYAVDLPCHQWDYVDGPDYLSRGFGSTAAGVTERVVLNITRRRRRMRFVATDDILDALRTFSILVQRFMCDVRFWPDYDGSPGTYWDLDWETQIAFSDVLDNRKEIELLVVEKSPGGDGA